MSRTPHLKKVPAALMLVLFLAVSFVGAEGTLLCFGKDGHIAIEFAAACKGVWLGSQLEGMEGDACGPCRDVQFLGTPAHTSTASHALQPFPLLCSSEALAALPPEGSSGTFVVPEPSSHHKTLASLHSVILLI